MAMIAMTTSSSIKVNAGSTRPAPPLSAVDLFMGSVGQCLRLPATRHGVNLLSQFLQLLQLLQFLSRLSRFSRLAPGLSEYCFAHAPDATGSFVSQRHLRIDFGGAARGNKGGQEG